MHETRIYTEDISILYISWYVTIVLIQIAIALTADAAKQVAFANWALLEFEKNLQWLLLWTDEAHFSLHGTVNTHN